MSEHDRLRISVTLKMMDGEKVDGDMILPIGGVIERTLNNEAKFVLFNDENVGDRYISKSAILEVYPRKKR